MRVAIGLVKRLVALALMAGAASQAHAAASAWAGGEHAQVRLIAATGHTEGGEPRLGLDFRMRPGWKIYWRSPGDAGLPPRVDWSAASNLNGAALRWPVPERFTFSGIETFGYTDRVVLPVEARVPSPDRPAEVRAKVRYLVCKDVCLPGEAELTLTLAPGTGPPDAEAHRLAKHRSRVPGLGADSGMRLSSAHLTGESDNTRLTLAVRAEPPLDSPDAALEGVPGVRAGPLDVTRADGGARVVLTLPLTRAERAPERLAGQTATVTVFDGGRGLTRQLTLTRGEAAGAPASPGAGGDGARPGTWAGMLAVALLGGLILNIMPCVLPVLSLKLMGVVQQGGRARGAVRASFLATAAGIVASFWMLAAGAMALKAGGAAVGWGMQFQQPLFVVGMIVVLTLFAANLAGAFEIRPPAALAGRADRAGRREGLSGHVLTGMFAALLATPCSAPFLGTAVAFALSRGPVEIAAIFTALGTGLALPYLAVAAVPGAAAALPKPGRWLRWVRPVLAAALAGTAVWLLTVLAAQLGWRPAGAVGALTLVLAAVLGARPWLGGRWRRAVPGAALAVALAAFAVPHALDGRAAATTADAWRPFDRDAIDARVADGEVVFVDVTAAWCVTCKVNKTRVLQADAVRRRLARDGVVPMRADWTSRSARIARYMADHGRYAVPFNAVYGPGAPDGIVLPELLATEDVISAVRRARGG